jgi:hypothetical protein
MTDHHDATELALFVRGELEGARRASFEAHVAGCEACAARLASEARLEVALEALGPALAGGLARRRRVRRAVAAAVVAAAAAVVLVTVHRGGELAPLATRSLPQVTCADGPDQSACIKRAHQHGLFVRYPSWAGAPPFGGLSVERGHTARLDPTASSGPSSPPFAASHAER